MRALVLIGLLGLVTVAHGQTFSVSPASGPGPFSIAWDVPNGTSCQAAGIADWSGAVESSGTKSVQPAIGPHTLTLVCTVPGPAQKGSVTIHWVPATQNVDGSDYVNPKDVVVFGSMTNPPTPQIAVVRVADGSAWQATGLDAGKWFFGAKSRNTSDVVSDLSVIASATVADKPTTQPWSGSAAITVLAPAKPKPPVLTVTVD